MRKETMRRSAYVISAMAIVLIAYACDGDDGDATPTASPPPVTSTPAPTGAAETPGASPTSELPAIVVDVPELGGVVEVPFEISGTANVFEAALSVQVVSEDGQLICQHNLTATSGTGTRGDWSTMMAFPPPSPPAGTTAVPMVVRAFDYSAVDGSEENVVTVEINVSGERPPNVIQTPLCGEQVPAGQPLRVTGVTDAFEGTLQLELQDRSGTVVSTQTVQAQGGLGNATWSADVSLTALDAGTYTLVAFDFSAEDGSRQHDFGIPIEVLP
jgi:hypothetical protein